MILSLSRMKDQFYFKLQMRINLNLKTLSEEKLLLNCLKTIEIILLDDKYLKIATTYKMVSKNDLQLTLENDGEKNSKSNRDSETTIASRYMLHDFMQLIKDVPFVECRVLLLTMINNIAEAMTDKSILNDINGVDKLFHQLLKVGNEKLSKEVLRTVKIFVIDRQSDIPTNNLSFQTTSSNDGSSSISSNTAPKLSDSSIAERVLSSLAPWMGSWGSGIVAKQGDENSDENTNISQAQIDINKAKRKSAFLTESTEAIEYANEIKLCPFVPLRLKIWIYRFYHFWQRYFILW